MSVPGGLANDFQALQRKCTRLEQLAVASPVNQCVQEGCQWKEKQKEIDRLSAKVAGLERALADIKRFVATANPHSEPK